MATVTQAQLQAALGSATFIKLFDDDKNGAVDSSDANVTAVLNRADYVYERYNSDVASNAKWSALLDVAIYYSWQRKGAGVPLDVMENYNNAIEFLREFKCVHSEIKPNYDGVAQPRDDWFDDVSDDEVNT